MNQAIQNQSRTNLAGHPVSEERWKELASSIRISPDQERAFLEFNPFFHQIRDLIAKKYGEDASASIFGGVEPNVVLYPPQKPNEYALTHPASFDLREVIDHIELLSKPNDKVLDIMCGSGTTLEAAYRTGRVGGGIELMDEWFELAKSRLSRVMGSEYQNGLNRIFLLKGDCREILPDLRNENTDLVVFSPPYFNILKNANGARAHYRKKMGCRINYGNSPKDLGNINNYDEFMAEMTSIYRHCLEILKRQKYMVLIVADIFSRGRFVPFHVDTMLAAESAGFHLKGVQVVMDHWKRKYVYGAPRSGMIDFHHHYALIFQKP